MTARAPGLLRWLGVARDPDAFESRREKIAFAVSLAVGLGVGNRVGQGVADDWWIEVPVTITVAVAVAAVVQLVVLLAAPRRAAPDRPQSAKRP